MCTCAGVEMLGLHADGQMQLCDTCTWHRPRLMLKDCSRACSQRCTRCCSPSMHLYRASRPHRQPGRVDVRESAQPAREGWQVAAAHAAAGSTLQPTTARVCTAAYRGPFNYESHNKVPRRAPSHKGQSGLGRPDLAVPGRQQATMALTWPAVTGSRPAVSWRQHDQHVSAPFAACTMVFA